MPCRHVDDREDASYLCLPLTAQGETLGVLHLRATGVVAADGSPATLAVNRPLVTTVCDQITLGIANLRLRDTLRHQSIHDLLTGLYNRRYMEEALQREVPRAVRNGRPLAVIMADLDHFKTFNDTFGHEAGDAVLSELGLLLKSSVRASDMACRYGGEEFALVLPETTLEGTLARVEAIRARVAALRVSHRNRMLGGLTLSLGVALLPQHGSSSEELLRAADKALYAAKQAGRNRAQVAEAEQDAPLPAAVT
jgi:diguanylate cyclase (GGDEF)-like protein